MNQRKIPRELEEHLDRRVIDFLRIREAEIPPEARDYVMEFVRDFGVYLLQGAEFQYGGAEFGSLRSEGSLIALMTSETPMLSGALVVLAFQMSGVAHLRVRCSTTSARPVSREVM
ncbi:hypothetical protein [Haloglycomyces albus]|uniref:hypothetical protein n=1 Tax=Haloglycomyces albus TaxID=526067 RepID=UPI0012EB4E93|nr:hypothetical protein [Haloglycomyces albus]